MTKRLAVLPLGLLTLLAACHRPSADDAAGAESGPVVKGKPRIETAEKQTSSMVHAASPAKDRTGGVDLKFHLAERPVTGKPIAIELALLAHSNVKNVVLDLTPGDGLALAAGAAKASIDELSAESVYRTTIDVAAAQPGILFLNAAASFDGPESSETREFSIPLIVGTLTAEDDAKH